MNAFLPLVVFVVLAGTAAWVHADAQRQADAGRPVVVAIGSFSIDSPVSWTIGCVVAWVVIFPLYLAVRRT